MAHTKSVQFYRNTTVIRPDTENNKTALTVAKETLDESGSKLDGELTLIRYKEGDEDPVKTLVGVYHQNGNTGTWSYLSENFPKIYIGTCASVANTYAKVATVETFPVDSTGKPLVGTIVGVKYSNTNTYKTEGQYYTLNVNSTGAYRMYYNTTELATSTSANTLVAGYKNRYIYYMFNGTHWVWLTASYETNSTYSAMSQSEIDAGTGTTGRTMTPARLRANFYTETEVDNLLGAKVNTADLATVATSGSYNDLSNKPTNVSDFTNDAGYQTKQRIVLYLKDVDTTTFKCTFRIGIDEAGNEISDEEALEIFNNLGNDIQINYDGALYHAFIEDGDRTFITISDDWYHYQFSTYCLANSGVYVYHTNTGEWNKDIIFTTPDDVMLNSHPANSITSSDITSWNNKEDRQKELLNISQNGNTITFTDSNNNTVTHAKVKTLLEDENKEVIFKKDDYYFIPQYHEDGTVIWYYQCFAGDENTFNYFEIRWAPVSSSLYLNNVRTVGYVPTSRTINTKPLSSNITLTASDVGALSSSTVVPDSITYDSNTKKIYLKSGNTTMAEIDATAFIKDGMVSSVEIVDDDIVITFNTDAGQEPITIPLADIFDPDQYYTKSEIDEAHFVIAQALSDLDDRVTDGLSVWDCGDY